MLGLYLEKNRDFFEEIFMELVPAELSAQRLFILAIYREILANYFVQHPQGMVQYLDNELIAIGELLEEKIGFAHSSNVELASGDYIDIVKAALPPIRSIN